MVSLLCSIRRITDSISLAFHLSHGLACPPGTSFPECRDVTAVFSLTLANEQNADSVIATLQEHLSESISDGSLQAILVKNNADTPVTILGAQTEGNPTSSPTAGPTHSPVSTVEAEATVLFQFGLDSAEEELENHLSDIRDGIEELMVQEFGDSLPANRQLKLSASTGGMSNINVSIRDGKCFFAY